MAVITDSAARKENAAALDAIKTMIEHLKGRIEADKAERIELARRIAKYNEFDINDEQELAEIKLNLIKHKAAASAAFALRDALSTGDYWTIEDALQSWQNDL